MAITYLSGERIQGVLGAKTPAEIGSVYEQFDCSQQVSASTWNDQDGSNNLTNNGATVDTASQNGYDTLHLDGASDSLSKTSGRTSSPTASFSWALVIKTPASTDDTNGESFCRTSGASNDYVGMSFNSYMTGIKVETAWAAGADSCKITDTNFLGEWIVLIATFTHGGKIRLYAGRNGDATELKSTSNNDYDTSDNTVGLGTALYLGVNGHNLNMYFDGHYAEVISFNKALSTTEAEQLGAHLLYKWGITSTNPSDKATITNVPLQTQFEETNTRKQYSYLYPSGTGDKTWIEMGTAGALTRTYGYTLLWSQTSTSLDTSINGDCGSNSAGIGEYFETGLTAVIGKKVNKIVVPLKKSGTLSGDFHCYVVKANGDLIELFPEGESSAMSADDLTTSYVDYTFINNDNEYVMANDDGVGFRYDSTTNAVQMGLYTSSGSNTGFIYICPVSATAWTQHSGYQLKITGIYEAY